MYIIDRPFIYKAARTTVQSDPMHFCAQMKYIAEVRLRVSSSISDKALATSS